MASIDTYVKLSGIDGEATHKDHKNEIEVLSWSWDEVNSAATAGGGSGKGKAIPGNFHFTHLYDKSSPVLAKNCAGGKHLDSVVFTCRKSGDGSLAFMTITLKEALVISVQPSASSGADIVEAVAMSYKSIEFAYKAQDAKGAMGGEVKFLWNVAESSIA
jgi:type VI secretion system secreted protein Hcp